ncbi:MAG: hypothetical protein LH491_08900 [Pseudoxanthomonas sp.]|nr:hypothetical protein [Pseudoxanthomonas sp.]
MNQPTPWKPPLWLLSLDLLGVLFLAAGLLLHFAPDTGLAAVFPPLLKLPLIVLGGVMLLAGVVLLLKTVVGHRDSGTR